MRDSQTISRSFLSWNTKLGKGFSLNTFLSVGKPNLCSLLGFQTGDTSQFDRTFTVVRFSLAAFSVTSAVEMIIIVDLVWK